MSKTPMELDASELTYDEWFFVWAVSGTRPNAKPQHIHEWHTRTIGMNEAQKRQCMQRGLESLIGRGFVVPDTDTDGRQLVDPQGQPVFKIAGNIVSRIRDVTPH